MEAWGGNTKCPRSPPSDLHGADTRTSPTLIPDTNLEALQSCGPHANISGRGSRLKFQLLVLYQLCDLSWPVWLQWHCENSSFSRAVLDTCPALSVFLLWSHSHLPLTPTHFANEGHNLKELGKVPTVWEIINISFPSLLTIGQSTVQVPYHFGFHNIALEDFKRWSLLMNLSPSSVFLKTQGLLIIWLLLLLLLWPESLPLSWNHFVPCPGCGHAWETAGGARWQMVREPVPQWEGARAREQAGSCQELFPSRSRLALRNSQSSHRQGAVLSAPQARAEEGGLLVVLLLFKLAWICSDPPRVHHSK